jgi:hypothetical protein
MISAEFIVNTGQFQHVLVKVTGEDAARFEQELESVTDELKEKLGVFQAELETWVRPTRDAILESLRSQAVDALIPLNPTVISETKVEKGPEPETAKQSWNQDVKVAPKVWDPKPKAEGKDEWDFS